jgi:hypothetical protein
LGGSETRRLQFRVESFNTFNHTQYTSVGATGSFSTANVNGTANFGWFTGAAPSRRFQVGLKLYF